MSSWDTVKRVIGESKSPYQIYHSSYSGAVVEIEAFAKKKGYTLDDQSDKENIGDQMATKVGMGPKKPTKGRTNKFTFTLYKNNKVQKKALHAQVYGDEGRFELNMYIS